MGSEMCIRDSSDISVFVPKSCSAAPNAANTNEHADTDGLLVSIDTVLLDDSGNASFSDDDSIIGWDEMFSNDAAFDDLVDGLIRLVVEAYLAVFFCCSMFLLGFERERFESGTAAGTELSIAELDRDEYLALDDVCFCILGQSGVFSSLSSSASTLELFIFPSSSFIILPSSALASLPDLFSSLSLPPLILMSFKS